MTTIKPPGGPGPSPTAAHMPELSPQADPTGPTESVPGATGSPGASEAPSTASSTASQRLDPHTTTTQSARAGAAADVTRVAGANLGSDPAAALAAAVERGQLSMAQAIDQLVDLTVDGMAEHLSEAERLELSEVLQLALTSDPTFSAMRGEQG